MSQPNPIIFPDRFSTLSVKNTLQTRMHKTIKRGLRVAFQWMDSKVHMCMQAMAEFMRAAASGSVPGLSPQIAFALIRTDRRDEENSKGGFYFLKGR